MLWIGQVLSDTGTEAALIAYPLLILALTHSPIIAGLVGTVDLVVQLILGLPGGAISDRLDRRLTMIVCEAGRAAVLALLAALVLVHLVTWPVVLAVAVIDGGANVLFVPSASAALPAIVADVQLERAWAATEARTYAASLAGPALGGFLFGLGRAVPFVGDAVSYLVSAGAVSRIRGKFRAEPSGGRKALWREVIDGLHLVSGGHARPRQQHRGPGSHGPCRARAADKRPARRAFLRPVDPGRVRGGYGHFGDHVGGPARGQEHCERRRVRGDRAGAATRVRVSSRAGNAR